MNEPRKIKRPMVTLDRLFLALGDHPRGKIFIRRRRRKGNRGMTIGRVNEREKSYIRLHFPGVAKAAKL